jgi:hypothetical protein
VYNKCLCRAVRVVAPGELTLEALRSRERSGWLLGSGEFVVDMEEGPGRGCDCVAHARNRGRPGTMSPGLCGAVCHDVTPPQTHQLPSHRKGDNGRCQA